MKSKIRNLHPHRVIVDDDLATRLATGIWEPPPSTSTHAAQQTMEGATIPMINRATNSRSRVSCAASPAPLKNSPPPFSGSIASGP